MQRPSILSETTLQFSGHETFPLRQLWLRKAVCAVAAMQRKPPKPSGVLLLGSEPPGAASSVFAAEHAIADFGVGKNMVTSIRHWALACGFLGSDEQGLTVSHLGRLVIGPTPNLPGEPSLPSLDPYLEHATTPWLLHWMLAARGPRSTTWHWLFNYVTQPTFDRDFMLRSLKQYIEAQPQKPRASDATLKRDIECCIRSYVPHVGGDSPEDVAEPILGELGIVTESSKGSFSFQRGPKHSLTDGLFAFCLLDFWMTTHSRSSSMQFHSAAHDPGSPGRVFKLDESSVAERMMALEDFTGGRMVWTDSAGLRQISRRGEADADPLAYSLELLRKAYA